MGDKVEGTDRLIALLYADDLVITCTTKEGLRECIVSLEEQTQKWGLTISVKKTKWLIANNTRGERDMGEIIIRNEKVERVKEFQYLGSILSENGTSIRDIERRIGLGTGRFMQLRKSVWEHPEISYDTKTDLSSFSDVDGTLWIGELDMLRQRVLKVKRLPQQELEEDFRAEAQRDQQ